MSCGPAYRKGNRGQGGVEQKTDNWQNNRLVVYEVSQYWPEKFSLEHLVQSNQHGA